MLDQVELSRTPLLGIPHQAAYSVELVVSREDKRAFAGFSSLLVLFLDFVDKLPDQIEHTVASPDPLPKVAGGISLPRRRDGLIAGAAEFALIDGMESCRLAFELYLYMY